MNTEIPGYRPAILSNQNLALLDKVRAFRHFIWHTYDCELDPNELKLIQEKLNDGYSAVRTNLTTFRDYLLELSTEEA